MMKIKPPLKNTLTKHPYLWVLLITTLIFRFAYATTHVAFGQDVARDAYLIEQQLESGQLIVPYGPKASVGNFYLPPFYYQLHLMLSSLTANHPLTMKWSVTLVESLTPVLLYLILRRLTQDKIAFVGGLLYAFALTPTIFGTQAWNPNMIPFFSLLALFSWLKAVIDRQHWYLAVAILSSSIACQLHYQSTVLLPFGLIVVAYLLLTRFRQVIMSIVLGSGAALVLLLPYLAGEMQHQFANTEQIVKYFQEEHAHYYDRISKPDYVMRYFPTFFEMVMFDKEQYRHAIGQFIYFGGGLLLVIGSLKKSNRSHRWLLLYLLTVAIMLRVYRGDKIVYYLSTLYLWPVLNLTLILDKLSHHWRALFIGYITFVIGWQISYKPQFNQLRDLQAAMAYLQQTAPQTSLHFLFHDDDHTNTVAYGLKKMTTLTSDPHSPVVVDVCNWDQRCAWDGTARGNYDEAYTVLAQYKIDAGYTYIDQYLDIHPFKLAIGRVQNPNLVPPTKTYLYQGEYGNDFLLK